MACPHSWSRIARCLQNPTQHDFDEFMAAVSVCPRHPQGPHLACPARFRPSSARGPSYSSPHVGLRCHGSHRARRSDGRPLTTCTSLLCGVQGQKAMWPVLPTLKCHCRVELELADCAARLQQQTRAENPGVLSALSERVAAAVEPPP